MPAQVEIIIHIGTLVGVPSEFLFYGGYELPDGKVVFNNGLLQTWDVQ
ncbi:MAG: hypothetical protein AAF512_22230 [Pseudomonadota bacterium]